MKVGMFINTQFPEGDNVAARVPELVEQVRLARDSGFASLLFPHHYLTAPLQMLQITPLMGFLLREAQGMTIGGNILLLPLLNPVHVAEAGTLVADEDLNAARVGAPADFHRARVLQ